MASDLSRLTRELRTLTSYVESTPPSQLDAAFVQTQTSFLSLAVNRLGAKSAALDAAATAYARAARHAASAAAAHR